MISDKVLKTGETVLYKGREYTVTGIGYGRLLEGQVRIEDAEGAIIVPITECAGKEGEES